MKAVIAVASMRLFFIRLFILVILLSIIVIIYFVNKNYIENFYASKAVAKPVYKSVQVSKPVPVQVSKPVPVPVVKPAPASIASTVSAPIYNAPVSNTQSSKNMTNAICMVNKNNCFSKATMCSINPALKCNELTERSKCLLMNC